MKTQAFLEVNNLRFRWQKSSSFELNISHFKLNRSEKLLLLGPSGSGKSSLLYLLGGLIQPQGGSIKFLDEDLTKASEARRDQLRANAIGFVFQMFNLLPFLSPLENVLLSASASPRRKDRAQKESGTCEKEAFRLMNALQLDASSLRFKPTHLLSVGEQQRVACARALFGMPDLILADEPTSALDRANRDVFLNLLFEELNRSNAGLLFVSHDESLIPHFDRYINLSEIRSGL